MDYYSHRKNALEKEIPLLKNYLKRANPDNLAGYHDGKKIKWYRVHQDIDGKITRTYLNKSDKDTVKALAIKTYRARLLEDDEIELKHINKLIKSKKKNSAAEMLR